MAAGGRPRAPVVIVDNVLAADELPRLVMSHRQLSILTAEPIDAICWCARYGLVRNSMRCEHCDVDMSFQRRNAGDYVDGYMWCCRLCRSHRNLRKDSFFSGSHLQLAQLLDILYFWSTQTKQADVSLETGVSCHTLVDWQNFIRDICCQYLLDHPVEMGGPGRTVEVDESKFMHRKYHRGAYRKGHWVLGMVERESNLCMMVEVENRTAETLLPIIARHVLPGTRILTDGWAAYNQLPQHEVVNHRLHFVDPNDPTLHTNTIEGSWGHVKTKFRAMHGTSDGLFNSHLQEFLWRRVFQDHVFGNILFWIRHYYPV